MNFINVVKKIPIDLIDFLGQAVNEVNLPHKFILVYEEDLT